MENLILSKDLIERYSAYQAELAEQSTEAVDGILEFEESPIKESEKSVEAQDPLQEVNLGPQAARRKPFVPCYFVYGDSVNGNGNNVNLPSSLRPVFLPYGIDFPDGPTGRYSNGRNFDDVVAQAQAQAQEQFLGFDNFIPPYANASGRDILQGVNYACAGAGILYRTGKQLGNVATFTDQLKQHQYVASEIAKILGDENSAAFHLKKCLYYVDLGNNDYLGNYFGFTNLSLQYTPELYANLLVETYSQKMKDLYNYGARKMILSGANFIGCTAFVLAHSPPTFSQCIGYVNFAMRIFDDKLKSLVSDLNKHFADAKFTYQDTSAIFQELLDNPLLYGFKVTTTACCGHGRKRGKISCQKYQIPCKNRDEYLFWDLAHPTEAVNVVAASKLFSDEAELFTYPFTISQLAQL
ncbi:GDSL esterase/lipase At1g29670-like [Syzygium oleosum]|uniref:GDSL esterase/lipase At1g29670-like n=1 Tax=Syzygium oleosum TaxID=219896 RepID=UPI0024B908DD|nr:GDSL esterase/lipase At1g29670-like [Syzygium oleosum]